jgi:hypothetical protein
MLLSLAATNSGESMLLDVAEHVRETCRLVVGREHVAGEHVAGEHVAELVRDLRGDAGTREKDEHVADVIEDFCETCELLTWRKLSGGMAFQRVRVSGCHRLNVSPV